ncbi:fungal specific transcription factor domain-containing protein [Aspergillus stella-maris]|uniref:fungal specific transcription factor domain-containing protein n=1 Tax=Aspergillus stella-maris TaxID=1810926 RepID=UPI003CCCC48F
MSASPKLAYGKVGCGEKQDRVQRACDRCNNSRTRCSGEVPWSLLPLLTPPELNYACQYDRTVKKRGPKPRSAQGEQTNKRSIYKGYPSSSYRRSSNNPSGVDKSSLCPASDWDTTTTDSQSSTSGSEIGSFDLNVLPGMDTSQSNDLSSPDYTHFPLNLTPVRPPNKRQNYITLCRYPCLNPVLPLLKGTMGPQDACNLLDIFFTDPDTSGSKTRCPYVLSPVIRVQSVLREDNARPVSPALLTIILWCVSHTADLLIFSEPSARSRATQRLYFLSMKLLRARDSDGSRIKNESCWATEPDVPLVPDIPREPFVFRTRRSEPKIDDVLSYVLLACVISGTKFKEECSKWWNKAVLLVKMLGLNSEQAAQTPCSGHVSLAAIEELEERRRTFWLVYALDRHFSLLVNEPLHIHDFECQVLYPLPEWIWRDLDKIPLEDIPPRLCGPPTQVTGTGFFEHFLPAMTILGDILELRSRSQHPRLGSLNEVQMTTTVEAMIADFECGLEMLRVIRTPIEAVVPGDTSLILPNSPTSFGCLVDSPSDERRQRQTETVIAYSQYMIRVLRLLLHKGGDSISAAENSLDCTLAPELLSCDANSISMGDSIAHILEVDPNLELMLFVFGTYLFHGSMSFLSQSKHLTRLGLHDLARHGTEAIVRANEMSVRSLDTSFQRHFTRMIRQYTCTVGVLGAPYGQSHDGDCWTSKVGFMDNVYY